MEKIHFSLARITVKEGMVDANLEISGTVDKTAEDARLITLDLIPMGNVDLPGQKCAAKVNIFFFMLVFNLNWIL